MNQRKISLLTACLLLIAGIAQSQTVKDGILLMEKEEYQKARTIFRQLSTADPKNEAPLFYLGESYYQNDNSDSAKYYYNKAISANPKGSLGYVGLGKLALDAKNTTEAVKQFNNAEKYMSRKDLSIVYEIGKAYTESKNPDGNKAIEYLKRAQQMNVDYKIDPSNSSIFSVMGDAYELIKDGGNAMSSYEFAIDKGKNDPKNYLKRARLWMQARNYDKAAETLEQCLKLDPNYVPAIKDLIEAYILAGKLDKVTPLLEKYNNMVSDDLESKARYVRFLTYQARDFDKAIVEAQGVLAKDSNYVSMYRWLGYAHYEKGNFQEAYDNMSKFLSNPGDTKIYPADYKNLARSAAKLNNIDAALAAYKQLTVLDTTVTAADYLDDIAKAYYDAKDFTNALLMYKKKLESGDTTVQDLYYIGLSQFNLEQYLASDSTWAKVTELSPNYILGWVYRARCQANLDPEIETGAAKKYYDKVIELSLLDAEKNKRFL
ncbi:MAG: tetratricopeptide repeat protein, partial [Saprospiraceae bacterium]